MKDKIVIVDYGMGNLGSIQNMFHYLNIDTEISSKAGDIRNADKLVLSGVGAFDNGIRSLKKLNLIPELNKKVIDQKTPILGICLGMHLFSNRSKEGHLQGLGWINADAVKFDFKDDSNRLKVPHMGWNTVKVDKRSLLFNDQDDEHRFYFVHSFHLICKNREDILCTTMYGKDFVSAIEKENIYGVQFHPEKSHRYGMKLLLNFAERV